MWGCDSSSIIIINRTVTLQATPLLTSAGLCTPENTQESKGYRVHIRELI